MQTTGYTNDSSTLDMAYGKKTGGRQKRTPNRVNASVKENMIAVFQQLGGIEHMALWAKDNPTAFYQLYGRLIPTETSVDLSVNRDRRELSDDDLLAIAGRGRTPAKESGKEKPSSVH